ncbi:MAG: DUF3613 domain-containing protein [Ottowia sp.]|uniref:DUF3613 domain-containing protein n=1 Tax=Ottowia sp. TaxID=1898956 RepID=UPI003C72C389
MTFSYSSKPGSRLPLLAFLLLMTLSCAAQAAADETLSRKVEAVEAPSDAIQTTPSSNAADAASPPHSPTAAVNEPVVASDGVPSERRIDVGAATGSLLAMQRESQGLRPRPIDGEQARRSYQRYLKSFETTIPERFDTGLEIKK